MEEVAASVTKDQHLTCLLSVDPYLNVDAIERLNLINIYTIIVYEGLIIYKLVTVYPCSYSYSIVNLSLRSFPNTLFSFDIYFDAVLYSLKTLLATENPMMENHRSMTSLNNFSELASSGISDISSQWKTTFSFLDPHLTSLSLIIMSLLDSLSMNLRSDYCN